MLTAVLVMLAVAAPAPRPWDGDGAPPVREPLPAGVEIVAAPCPFSPALGCSDGSRVWSDPSGDPALAAYRVRHELGHVQDHRHYSVGERNRLTVLLGFPAGTPWSQGTWPKVDRSPEEVAADAFATCSLGLAPDASFWVMTAYSWDPSARQQRLVCGTIRRAISNG